MKLEPTPTKMGTSYDTILTAIKERERSYLECPLSELSIDRESGELVRGSDRFSMTPYAAKTLAYKVEVPGPFAVKAPTEVVAPVLNFFLPRQHGQVRLAIEKGDKVVGVTPQSKNPVEAEALVDHLSSGLHGMELVKWILDEKGLKLRFVTPSLGIEPRVGDIVRAGVDIDDYENDNGQLGAMGILERLVCSNGMICPELSYNRQLQKETWRNVDQIIRAAEETMTNAAMGMKAFAAGLPRLTEMEIDRPDSLEELEHALLHGPMKTVKVPTKFAASLADAFKAEESTLYGFYNANTRLGRDAHDRDVRRKFENAGFLTVTEAPQLAAVFAEALHAD